MLNLIITLFLLIRVIVSYHIKYRSIETLLNIHYHRVNDTKYCYVSVFFLDCIFAAFE